MTDGVPDSSDDEALDLEPMRPFFCYLALLLGGLYVLVGIAIFVVGLVKISFFRWWFIAFVAISYSAVVSGAAHIRYAAYCLRHQPESR